MEAKHAFMKGRFGHGIFYRTEDFLVFITIISVLVRKMGLTVIAFCPMFNHVHFLVKDIKTQRLRLFILRAATLFVKQYNLDYSRKGPLFKKPFGYSVKKSVKIILGSVAYVFNNPVAGKLSKKAIQYRWNLLAYIGNRTPFSKPIRKDLCRHVMRLALKKVDYFRSRNMFLTYNALRNIFKNLDEEEHKQIIDYILFSYIFLSFESLEELYGNYDKLIASIDSNAGSEFDLEDEYGDHSCYRTMLNLVKKLGYKDKKLNFEMFPDEEVDKLFSLILTTTNIPPYNINRFLHRNNEAEQ